MIELYYSILDVKYLIKFLNERTHSGNGLMLQLVGSPAGVRLTSELNDAPSCQTVKVEGTLPDQEEFDEHFPVKEEFVKLILETDNWGHLVLALTEDEMNVFLEESGMRGCMN
jgi:hypothetical protein